VEFTQELSDPAAGYAYLYRKTVRLEKGKPQMVIEHSLKNTGQRPIQSTVYNHNFVSIDKAGPGPYTTFRVPYHIRFGRASKPRKRSPRSREMRSYSRGRGRWRGVLHPAHWIQRLS